MACILALDQGTTTSRAFVIADDGRILGQGQHEFRQHFPKPGWVEHDAEEIWASQTAAAQDALTRAGLAARDIAAIGIANQRETTVLWERATGKPVAPVIVWQDRRTAALCEDLVKRGLAPLFQAKTGLLLDPYFSATKLQWLLEHVPGARNRAVRGELAFGTVDSWLAWKLTGGRYHITDASNASRTLLYDLHSGQWDDELLRLLDIPHALLPEVKASSAIHGECERSWLGVSILIAGIAGDQQAATFGQRCHAPGMVKNTYGTGCFMLMNTGTRAIASAHRLVSTVAWQIDGRTDFALEGSVFMTGATVQWLRDGLALIKTSDEVEALAASVPDNGGVYLVPAFTVLGAPHWQPQARGCLSGLSRGSGRGHIARAALEAIAYQSADVLHAMEQDAGAAVTELRVDGGAAKNDLLLQFQADILDRPVVRPENTETTALGAAFLAGLAVGVWHSVAELPRDNQGERRFEPHMAQDLRERLRAGWSAALTQTLAVVRDGT